MSSNPRIILSLIHSICKRRNLTEWRGLSRMATGSAQHSSACIAISRSEPGPTDLMLRANIHSSQHSIGASTYGNQVRRTCAFSTNRRRWQYVESLNGTPPKYQTDLSCSVSLPMHRAVAIEHTFLRVLAGGFPHQPVHCWTRLGLWAGTNTASKLFLRGIFR